MSNKPRRYRLREQRANVFAAQKQCFCFERLSAPNCLFALRSKRKGRSSRAFVFPFFSKYDYKHGQKYTNTSESSQIAFYSKMSILQ
ncbi:hypothetical protein [Gardnerella vaginalis]|uniref:hypothetical protein n=1 Tax=Gardnerella vaginalis TaxID=2702 RepID=UPI0012BADDD7|nr:hypothetical protein [Gardnerella vaginalis]